MSVESIRRGAPWTYVDDYQEHYTKVVATLGRQCREWKDGETDKAIEEIIADNSREDDAVVFTDGSVQRGVKSGWAFTVRVNGTTVAEKSGAVSITTSSMLMEINAITEALRYLKEEKYTRAVIVTDSMSTLQKVQKENLYADWVSTISDSCLERLTSVFSPGHAGVKGNERADCLAGDAVIADRFPSRIHFIHSLPFEREGGSAKRRSHLQPQGCGSPTPKPARHGNSEPPNPEMEPDVEGGAGMELFRLPGS